MRFHRPQEPNNPMWNIDFNSTIVVFDGAEYVIKASNVDEKHYDVLSNLHTEEIFQDSSDKIFF